MSLARHTAIPIAIIALLLGSYGMARAGSPLVEPTAADGQLDIVVEGRQFSYEPAVIHVAEGQRVRITFKAMDVTHGLYVDDYGAEVHATPGHPQQLDFVAHKTGQFRFRCTQTCGALHPFMTGKLVVDPNTPFDLGLGLLGLATVGSLGLLYLRQRPVAPTAGGAVSAATAIQQATIKFDLLKVPLIGRFLRWRGLQFSLSLPLLALMVIVLAAAIAGTPVGSHNFGIVAVWIVWWPLLITLLIPLGGRLWCAVCPLPSPGEWLQRLSFISKRTAGFGLGKRWPAPLRNMWLQNGAFLFIALFSAVILTNPSATAAVLAAFFAGGVLLSVVFSRRTFCRYVCPLGGFIGLCSLVAPLALRVKNYDLCRSHSVKECFKGNAGGYGCPWFEYPGTMQRNAYCGLCTECVKTCDRNNIALGFQPFGSDLAAGKHRLDEAYRAFIALGSAALYAAVMLGPWGWLKSLAGNPLSAGFAIYVAMLLATCLIAVPGLFFAATYLAKAVAGLNDMSAPKVWLHFAYGLVPLALMAWIAFSLAIVFVSGHYVMPVLSDPLGHGWNLFGTAGLEGGPLLMNLLPYLQIFALLLGLVWSINTSWRLALAIAPNRRQAWQATWPLSLCLLLIAGTFLWLYLG